MLGEPWEDVLHGMSSSSSDESSEVSSSGSNILEEGGNELVLASVVFKARSKARSRQRKLWAFPKTFESLSLE